MPAVGAIRGLTEFNTSVQKMPSELMITTLGSFQHSGSLMVARRFARTPVRTGNLRSGNHFEVIQMGNTISLIVFNDVSYAEIVNEREHVSNGAVHFFDVDIEEDINNCIQDLDSQVTNTINGLFR